MKQQRTLQILFVWNLALTTGCVASLVHDADREQSAHVPARRIEAEEFVLVRGGRVVARLGGAFSSPASPGLSMYDENGEPVLHLSVHAGNPELAYYNEDGSLRMCLDAGGTAPGGLRLFDIHGVMVGDFVAGAETAWASVRGADQRVSVLRPPE